MKRVYRILSLLMTGLLLVSLMAAAFAADSRSYLALGDSISTGYGLSSPSDEAFPALVKELLGESYTLTNMAEDGETAASLASRLDEGACMEAVACADVITVTIGGNDLMAFLYEFLADNMALEPKLDASEVGLKLASGNMEVLNAAADVLNTKVFALTSSDLNEVAISLSSVVSKIRALNPTATVIVTTQYNPYAELASQVTGVQSLLPYVAPEYVEIAKAILSLSGDIDTALASFNALVKDGASASAYQVADVAAAFSGSTGLCNAGLSISPIGVNLDIHPTQAGHKVIADTIEPLLPEEPPVHACSYSYSAEGNVITESCSGCDHSETATLSAPSGDLVYDGTRDFTASVTYSQGWQGSKELEIAYTRDGSTVTSCVETGDYTASITAGGASASVSYTVTAPHTCSYTYSAEGNVITQRCSGCDHSEMATLSAPSGDLVYDGTTAFNASVTYSQGWQGSKDLEITYTRDGSTVTSCVEAGEYTASITAGGVIASVSFTVDKAPGKVLDLVAPNVTYSGAPINGPTFSKLGTGEATIEYKPSQAEDSAYTTQAPVNAGSYTVRVTVAADNNYSEAQDVADFQIEKAPLTVTAKDSTIIYGQEPMGSGVSYEGFVGDDDFDILDGSLYYNSDYCRLDDVGNGYTITPYGLTSGNYDISFQPGTLTVLPAEPVITYPPISSRLVLGSFLSTSSLIGGIAEGVDHFPLDGQFQWTDRNALMTTAGKIPQSVTFTPTSSNYTSVTTTVEVEVVLCDTPSGDHDYTELCCDAAEHWLVCAKCHVEEPGSREAHSGGTATCTEQARCADCGQPYGDLLEHSYEWVIDEEPTQRKEGSKHEECACGARRNEGTVIPRLEPDAPETGDSSNLMLWTALMAFSAAGLALTALLGKKKSLLR